MPSFTAKIVWKRPRKRENKNYCFITFLPNALQKILKKQQKNKKIPLSLHFKPKSVERKCQENAKKKQHYGIISSQNSFGKAKKEKN